MSTLIFDIETVGENWNDLDDTTQSVLTRWIGRTARTEDEKDVAMRDLQEGLGFSPLTGSVVAVGLYDLERTKGAVYYTGEGSEPEDIEGKYVLKQCSEKKILEDFWEGATSYDTFVTFNGRVFDVPFLLHRSVANNVRPTVDLMTGRYLYQQKSAVHIDLLDQLTFYGAMNRKPSLHLFCRAYGIESPKMNGVAGDSVAELFQKKKFRDIAVYNARDVIATTALYEKWLQYFVPTEFLNREM